MRLNWRQRQKQELRQLLYDAAVQLFETEGYESTSVQQIVKTVGVAKGTFFNHFPTKEHVVSQWYNDITAKAIAAAQARQNVSAEDAICSLFADMARQATASPQLLIAKASHSCNPLLLEAERHQGEVIDAIMHTQCAAAKANGELSADLDQTFFIELLGAVLTGTSRNWVLTEPRFDFPAVITERVRFLFRGARPVASS